jgi:hypothetical protein
LVYLSASILLAMVAASVICASGATAAHDRVGGHVNGEHPRELFDTLGDPASGDAQAGADGQDRRQPGGRPGGRRVGQEHQGCGYRLVRLCVVVEGHVRAGVGVGGLAGSAQELTFQLGEGLFGGVLY